MSQATLTKKPSLAFIVLVFLTALGMEGIGTYVSVFGLSAMFAGDPVILGMAVILDLAKIVSVSFIYQYRELIVKKMKYYLLLSVIVLMSITSSGAFGYLSGAFQRAVQPVKEITLRVEAFKLEREQLNLEREQLLKQRADIDQQIAHLPPEYVRSRRQLISSFKPESDQISNRLSTVTKRVDELNENILKVESENIAQEVHVSPITTIAKSINVPVEKLIFVIILVIILVFDPLAIILIVAGNFLLELRGKFSAQMIASTTKLMVEPEEILVPQSSSKQASAPPSEEQDQSATLALIERVKNYVPSVPAEQVKATEVDEVQHVDEVEIQVKPEELKVDLNIVEPTNDKFIDVSEDLNYSGSPQSELIDESPLTSSLEAFTINIPEALLRVGVRTSSTKRPLYNR